LYTSCVLGLRPSALFNEFLLIKKKVFSPVTWVTWVRSPATAPKIDYRKLIP